MTQNRKITSLEFDYLTHMKPYVAPNDKNSKKSLKYALIDTVERVFGDMWFNLNEKTRQAIDYICFLSVEHGFFYASPEHIATRSGIGKSTIYKALKLMREFNVLVKVNRSSRKQNGLGCPVHFFTEHPYFQHYNTYLDLKWKPEEKADEKAENVEIPCGSKDEGSEKFSTLPLTSLHHQKMDLQPNVKTDSSSKKFIKYVPQEINELYANIFDFRLRNIWQKVTQAWKSIKQSVLQKDDLITIGANICKRIWQIWKERQRSNQDLSVDEMCAFAYKSARETFFHSLASFHMEGYDVEDRSISISRRNASTVPNNPRNEKLSTKFNKPIPRGVEAGFMNKLNKVEQLNKEHLEQAKSEIPTLEDIYLRKCPYASLDMVKKYVLSVLEEKYNHLDAYGKKHLDESYHKYTKQCYLLDEYNRRREEEIEQTLKKIKEREEQKRQAQEQIVKKLRYDEDRPF
ncbi:hypothetical protein [Brevibacillus laterosporus]|uniref:hypothetical protein n=1 Tax=Brevibacillus laterosporus TaxID=1465 RepID=UPI00215BE9A3|nr:hypothetical protein [Brevibacillus laterosporus]MCR8994628.1 hypothetical protein [Brevibacillus laterosporus]